MVLMTWDAFFRRPIRLTIGADRSRERAVKRILALRKDLPPDWKFDRDEANARGRTPPSARPR